ncbi:hypothetical protein LNTAR_11206 [Lentisphaera araneosa HTCC2155]|uniref:Uncharacterized protein n=1 Tax=Lentisphaera araneosa HTCC2155 TaxID=313628 RepID=A6DJ44_9BACT|nr:AAA family ATPase [Lentisphaera araneosa]EDM28480.1 hypothetical protein LNTAR_11206 [Lentisphaera araneosa HTCC2155]
MSKLIYLNGASSSGKTEISKELQIIFEETFLHISSDTFSSFYPPKKAPLKNYSAEYLSAVRKNLKSQEKPSIVQLYNSFILSMLKEGMNVIADTTFLKYMTIEEIKKLAIEEAYLIDVTCDLEIMEEREKKRADRPIGAAKTHVEFCYDYKSNDFCIDTSKLDAETCAEQIKKMILSKTPQAFTQIIRKYQDQPQFSLFENWTKNQ